MDLIQKSKDLKKDADLVISKLKIKEILKKLGKVTFVGSYALDLLFRPDIDIYVQSRDCSRKKAVNITKILLDSDLFQTVGFADWSNQPSPSGERDFYWELINFSHKYQWKFDVWYTRYEDIKTIWITEKIINKLKNNPNARLQILQLKDKYYDGVKYRNGMNGIKIYEQVLGKID
jgi:hypothetical protein